MIPKVSPMSEDEKNREIGIATDNPYYVTFQGVANHFPPQHQHPQAPSANYYQRQGYHVVPGTIHSQPYTHSYFLHVTYIC